MLHAEKSFEAVPKQNTFGIFPESIALNLIISTPFTTNKCLLHYNTGSNNLLLVALKLIECIFSAVNECSPNPLVEPLPRIKMPFFYYQYKQMNSYLLQRFLRYCRNYQLDVKKLLFHQIQYYIQNIYTYQHQSFWLI